MLKMIEKELDKYFAQVTARMWEEYIQRELQCDTNVIVFGETVEFQVKKKKWAIAEFVGVYMIDIVYMANLCFEETKRKAIFEKTKQVAIHELFKEK